MKTAYVYLFRSDYTADHIDKMESLLHVLDKVQELEVIATNDRTDLNAFEYELNAVTPWGMEFLEHMSLCDMLHVSDSPIVAN